MIHKIIPHPKIHIDNAEKIILDRELFLYSNFSGIFVPDEIVNLYTGQKVLQMPVATDLLCIVIAKSSQVALQIVNEASSELIFSHKEEYYLSIYEHGILLASREECGILNALASLKAIVNQSTSEQISGLTIRDYPDFSMRGVMICWHQMHDFMPYFGPDFQTVISVYLNTLFDVKINYLLLEYEAIFPWRKHSAISCRDAMSEKQLKQLSLYAGKRGIEIIPLVQTLGHVYHILIHDRYKHLSEDPDFPQQLCPLQEESIKLALDLIDETIALHPNSRYIHLGGDECRRLGVCPKCNAYAEKHGKYMLYAQYYKKLTDYVIKKGITPILWHDIAVKQPKVLKEFSNGVIFQFWNYGDRSHGKINPLLEKLANNIPANRLIGGSAVRCEKFHGCIFPSLRISATNIEEMNRKIYKVGGLGTIMTDWPDSGIPFLCSLPSLSLQSDSSWNVLSYDFNSFKKEYTKFRFGFENHDFFDKLISLYGEIPFALGFQHQLDNLLNRYKFKAFDFDSFVAELIEKHANTSFIYQLFNRVLQCKDLINYFAQCRVEAKQNSFELELYSLCAELTHFFCRLTASIITIKATPEKLELGWRLEEAVDELQNIIAEWESLKEKVFLFYCDYTAERHLHNWLDMVFKPEIKKGAQKLLSNKYFNLKQMTNE